MSLNDPLANVLSMIKTYDDLGKRELYTKSNSLFIRKVLSLLQDCRYIGSVEEIEDGKGNILKVNLLGVINGIGVIKPRFSVQRANFDKYEKRFLPAKNFGILIVSTNKGLVTHLQAKQHNIGGKLICYCY
jgi:small subunit ribosomal protein S8